MNKVININFQGSIIPIEESASELLRNYISSLRQYFAQEEGRDEIISDIESRIAELFLQRLKKGAVCISDTDMKEIMSSIGHPNDLEAAEAELNDKNEPQQKESVHSDNSEKKRLYRASNNQLIGGVSAGLGDYLGIDPSIVRILFVFSLFAGFGLIVYIVLWAVLPQKEIKWHNNHGRRLFRNPDDKKLGGVASGIAAYFEIDVWIPRLIFLLPILLASLSGLNHSIDLHFLHHSNFIFGGFGGSLFVVYFVLWAVLPEANSAAEKLQMRGEKIDLESIKKTVNEEMHHLKERAEQWGKDAGKRATEKAKKMQEEIAQSAQNFTAQTNNMTRRSSTGLGNAIGMLAKIFVFGIAGIVILSLLIAFVSLVGGLITGHQVVNFILVNDLERNLLWASIILFLGVPIIGLLMWLVRVVRGVQSRNKYVSYMFTFLHILGWVSVFALLSFVGNHFNSKSKEISYSTLYKPSQNKLLVMVDEFEDEESIEDWASSNRWPKLNGTEDSVYSSNIKIKVVQSKDSLFHVKVVKMANGQNVQEANLHAQAIQYYTHQQDTILHLDKYIRYSKADKFHLQQAMVIVEMPIGAKITLHPKINDFEWYNVQINTGTGFSIEHHENHDEEWEYGKAYLMEANGLNTKDSTAN